MSQMVLMARTGRGHHEHRLSERRSREKPEDQWGVIGTTISETLADLQHVLVLPAPGQRVAGGGETRRDGAFRVAHVAADVRARHATKT